MSLLKYQYSIFLDNIFRVKKENLFLFLLFLGVFFISAFRPYHVGTDTMKYVDYFRYSRMSLFIHKEIGYEFLIKLLRSISRNPRILLVVFSFIILFPIYRASLKYSKAPLYTWLIFSLLYFAYSLNVMRQFLSISIFYFFGIQYILKRNFIAFLITIIICSSFHITSIILFPLYFFLNFYPKKITIIIIWFLTFIITFMNFEPELIKFLIFIDKTFFASFGDHRNYLVLAKTLVNPGKSLIRLYVFNLFFITFWLYTDKIREDPMGRLFYNIFLIGILISNLFYRFDVIIRVMYYFQISIIFLISYTVQKENRLIRLTYYSTFFAISLAFFIYSFVLHGQAGVF